LTSAQTGPFEWKKALASVVSPLPSVLLRQGLVEFAVEMARHMAVHLRDRNRPQILSALASFPGGRATPVQGGKLVIGLRLVNIDIRY